jgi:hypothetical protein
VVEIYGKEIIGLEEEELPPKRFKTRTKRAEGKHI